MNEPSDKIEQMLCRLELREPSQALDRRMADLFAQAPAMKTDFQTETDSFKFRSTRSTRSAWISALAGVAAVIAIAWFANQHMNLGNPGRITAQGNLVNQAPDALSASSVQSFSNPQLAIAKVQAPSIHVGESQIVDEGFTTTPSGDPVRVLRRQSVQRSMWVDPDTQAHVQVEVPNEEVVLIDSPTY